MRNWSVTELDVAIKKGKNLRLIDVREPEEFAICRIADAELIPMSEIPGRAEDILASEGDVVLYCHHGVRSEHALNFLLSQGAQNVGHLTGGIDAWAEFIDPNMVRY